MDLGNLPSYITSYFLSTASFPSAYKHADIFPILKKSLTQFLPSATAHTFPFTAHLWENCLTASSSFSNIWYSVAAME